MHYIAVAGKGGTGKTTISALLVDYLSRKGPEGAATLAIDADPNSNLGEALGLVAPETIASVLEEVKTVGQLPAGMTRQAWIQYRLNQLIVETEHFDLLSMGTPEGPGCYCYPNDLLRGHLQSLGQNYRHVVIDNEAGLEHLSRRVEQDIDLMLIVSDSSARGVRTAGRVVEIIKSLNTAVHRMGLVLNRSNPTDAETLAAEVTATGLELLGTVPDDPAIRAFDLEGKPLVQLPPSSPARVALAELFSRLGI